MIWHLQINESKIGRVEMEIHIKKIQKILLIYMA